MGNYRFRLSHMIPNAWFYKLKDMNKSRNQQKIIYHSHGSKKTPHHTSSSSFSSSSSSSFSSSMSCKERQHQHQHQGQLSQQRKSYYFSRDLGTAVAVPGGAENGETKSRILLNGHDCVEPVRKSSKKRRSTKRNRGVTSSTSSVAAAGGCSCRATVESVWTKPDSATPEDYPNSPLDTSSENEEASLPTNYYPEILGTMLSWSSSTTTYCRDKLQDKDIIMDIGNKTKKIQEPVAAGDKNDGFHTVSQMNLPPIITNRKKIESLQSREPTKAKGSGSGNKLEERNVCVSGSGSGSVSVSLSVKEQKNEKKNKVITSTPPARRISANSCHGVKLRTNSPRIMNRGRKSVSIRSRRSISESFAVVKSSKDPQRDFRDSMVEMIMENNLCASKDLEDLLACYLSLNSDEYHDLIISVFKQIWFDIIDIHLPK